MAYSFDDQLGDCEQAILFRQFPFDVNGLCKYLYQDDTILAQLFLKIMFPIVHILKHKLFSDCI